jgi:hypothetical protein
VFAYLPQGPTEVMGVVIGTIFVAGGLGALLRPDSARPIRLPALGNSSAPVFRKRPTLSNPLGADWGPPVTPRELHLSRRTVRVVGIAQCLLGVGMAAGGFLIEACPAGRLGCSDGRWGGKGGLVLLGIWLLSIAAIALGSWWTSRRSVSATDHERRRRRT